MNPPSDNNKGFTGLWIPKALCEHPDLNWSERALVAEVDTLTTDESPCFKSNSALAKRLHLCEQYVADMLSTLQKKKIIMRLGFHRIFAHRVANPQFSRNPQLSEKWIAVHKASRVSKKTNPQQASSNGAHPVGEADASQTNIIQLPATQPLVQQSASPISKEKWEDLKRSLRQ